MTELAINFYYLLGRLFRINWSTNFKSNYSLEQTSGSANGAASQDPFVEVADHGMGVVVSGLRFV